LLGALAVDKLNRVYKTHCIGAWNNLRYILGCIFVYGVVEAAGAWLWNLLSRKCKAEMVPLAKQCSPQLCKDDTIDLTLSASKS
jgi:hypothetical protein